MTLEHRSMARLLMVLNQARGRDSWGFFFQDSSGKLGCVKDTGPAIVRGIEALATLSSDTRFLVGHTRHATHGAPSIENAHPFREEAPGGSVFLVHNGVVTVDGFPVSSARPVDSWALTHAIATLGPIEAISRTRGSVGLLFFHDGRLLAYRGHQDLALLELDDCWLISSSGDHLAHVRMVFRPGQGTIRELEPETLIAPWEPTAQPIPCPMGGNLSRTWDSISRPASWDSVPTKGTARSVKESPSKTRSKTKKAKEVGSCGFCARQGEAEDLFELGFRDDRVLAAVMSAPGPGQPKRTTRVLITAKTLVCLQCIRESEDSDLVALREDLGRGAAGLKAILPKHEPSMRKLVRGIERLGSLGKW